MMKTAKPSIETKKIAILIADGVSTNDTAVAKKMLETAAQALAANGKELRFILQAYKHCKAIGAIGDSAMVCEQLFDHHGDDETAARPGVVLANKLKSGTADFIQVASQPAGVIRAQRGQ